MARSTCLPAASPARLSTWRCTPSTPSRRACRRSAIQGSGCARLLLLGAWQALLRTTGERLSALCALSHSFAQLHRLSVREAVSTAVRREGVAGLYKGVGAVAAGAG